MDRLSHPPSSLRTARGGIWGWAPSVLLVGASIGFGVHMQTIPKDPHTVMALFPPWFDREVAFTRAATVGTIISAEPSYALTLTSPRDDLAKALRAVGAFAVIDPASAALCGLRSKETRP